MYIVLTILVGFSAVNTGNNLIYIIASALLSYMLVSGIFGRRNLLRLNIQLDIPPEVFAGTDTPIGIRLVNQKKFMPAFLIRVLIEGHQTVFPFIDAGSEQKHYCRMQFSNRGEYLIKDLYISSVFPFNFFSRYRKIKRTLRLIVLPKPQKCEALHVRDRQTWQRGETATLNLGYDSDIVSIRDYTPGDPLKYISWKSTAKTGVLKTKELSAIQLQPVMIDFDNMEKKDLEHAISCITFLIVKFIRSNIPVGMVIDGESFKPAASTAHKLNLLRKLALYGQN